jgi:hypothetical protein
MSNIDRLKRHDRSNALSDLLGIRRAVLVYSFSIRNGDGSDREVLGITDLLNDYAALAFGTT